MKTVSMLEFRKNALKVVGLIRKGQSVLMTYRGKPVCRLEPVEDNQSPDINDAFYQIASLAEDMGNPLTNGEMDQIIYDA